MKAVTVTALTEQIRNAIEPPFSSVWVEGELSNVHPAGSGHLYFSLKDSGAAIDAAWFGWAKKPASRLFEVKNGLQVSCIGRIAIYPPRGRYQIIVERLEPLGLGALNLRLQQLKERLQAKGYFESARKRALPSYPRSVAIVTSPEGAVIRDLISVISRRAPHMNIKIIPSRVQGDGAAEEVARAIKLINTFKIAEVLVLARGGGSVEDLWSFNEEVVADAIFESEIPVISAIGHETDTTIADYVADERAPTPSIAGERLTARWVEVPQILDDYTDRTAAVLRRLIDDRRRNLDDLSSRLISPGRQVELLKDQLHEWNERMESSMFAAIRLSRERLASAAARLNALSPLAVLGRGYTLLQDGGRIIPSAKTVESGKNYRLRFSDGEREVQAL